MSQRHRTQLLHFYTMKHFAVIAFLLFCGQTLAQTNGGSLDFTSSEPIQTNSTSVAICKISNYTLDLQTTPNLKVVVYAKLTDNKTLSLWEWSLNANNGTKNWKVSPTIGDKNISESGLEIIKSSYNLDTTEFKLTLKLNKDNAKGNYFCSLEKVVKDKPETLLTSKKVHTEKPIYTAELTVSTAKFTVDKQFTVNCKTASPIKQNDSEIVQVTFFKNNNEELAVYEHAKNESLYLTKHLSTKVLTVSEGKNTAQSVYQIQVKPLTKDAAGNYSCVAISKRKDDRTDGRSYESNVLQVNNSARWALPSITFLLVNLALFLHF